MGDEGPPLNGSITRATITSISRAEIDYLRAAITSNSRATNTTPSCGMHARAVGARLQGGDEGNVSALPARPMRGSERSTGYIPSSVPIPSWGARKSPSCPPR